MTHSLWMPLYWGDYFKKTLHLSLEEHGAYLLLIGAYWERGRALPDDDSFFRSVTKSSSKKWKLVRPKVSEFFVLSEGVWIHERIEEELLRSSNRQASAIANGRAGGLAKSKLPHHTNTIEEETSKKQKAAPAALFVLPDFIPGPAWDDFLEMRRKARKPATEKAKALLARSLEKLMIEGHDPASILEQSTLNNWADVYPIKEKLNGHGKRPTPHETFARAAIAVAKGE